MKVLVAVKRVADPNVVVQVKADGSGLALDGLKMSMNPFDEIGVEEAVRLKEAGAASEVVVVSIGPQQAADTLRAALAMGADRAVHVKTDAVTEPLSVAKLLHAVVTAEAPQLVILGKQAIDDDMNATGQMLAGKLGWAQATCISRLTVQGSTFEVTREIDGGTQILHVPLPALVTTDLRLNSPRYASLPNIMKAKKKPLTETTPETLGVDMATRLLVVSTKEAPRRKSGSTVASAAELARILKAEAGVA